MNTIYNGSFVIGETSGLTFEAGPGITVTEPTAGTVRIGADETVLWEGSANITSTTSYKTSESVANFDRIAIYGEAWNAWSPVKWGEICASGLTQASLDTSYLGSNGGAIRFVQIMFNFTNSGFTIPNCQLFSITGNGTQAGTPSNTVIRKVIGINHISGSNA